MNEPSPEERWMAMMAQAERFAEKDAFVEAAARAALVCEQIDAVLSGAELPQRARLERRRAYVQAERARYEGLRDAWSAAIAARRKARVDEAEAEMHRPLPPL